MTKPLVAIAAVAVCAEGAAAQPVALPSWAWAGTAQFTRGGSDEAFTISIEVRGRRAVASLGPGHAARTEVAARLSRSRVRLTLPGRPWRLALDGRVRGRILSGTVRQGPLRGRFRLRRRAPLEAGALGLYRFADGSRFGGVGGFGPRVGIRFEESEIRGLYPFGSFGAKDRTVPSRLCIERLDPVAREPGRDFTYVNFPGGAHGLVTTENGLLPEAARSNRIVRPALSHHSRLAVGAGFSQIS